MLDALIGQPEYQLFRRAFAERKAPLVLVTGSGLSAPAKLPTWERLRKKLEEDVKRKVDSLSQIGSAFLQPQYESLQKQRDPWIAFKLIREILTPPVFESLVEQYLTPDGETGTPPSYSELMKLQPRGLMTLNLDRFAGDAVAEAVPTGPITPIYGKEIASKWSVMRNAKTFLVYLHGGLHDPATWILTQDDLSVLEKSQGRNLFLNNLYNDHIVLFVGVSVDDVALSKQLLELREGGFRPKNLFWLTTRIDEVTSRWASDSYVSLIRYVAKNNEEHDDVIRELVTDCLTYVPKDTPEPPLRNDSIQVLIDPSPSDTNPDTLAQSEPEHIRRILASLLEKELREADDDDTYLVYRNFCNKYDYAVHRSFYKQKSERFNKWFGYKLEFPALGRGNFGEVFSAISPAGELVAIKIMHESIFGNDEMLGGFRRGVRSMEIVAAQEVAGMVEIKERYELPPTIVMSFASGTSLQDALQTRPDLPWSLKLTIAMRVGSIVAEGHALPQTVLHRDIKPTNIMIPNFEYTGTFDPDVIVLDFDMSWHKGSREKDVVFESRDDFGYLSPEQTDPTSRHSARSTRVDSYGFGMMLFYMFGLEPPRPNEALSDRWLARARRAAKKGYDEGWVSAPERLARLIVRATQIDQADRVDFASMVRELKYLDQAIRDYERLDNPEVWAEEVLARISIAAEYTWNDAVGIGEMKTLGGLSLRIGADFRSDEITFEARYTDRGMRDRGSLAKYISSSTENACRTLAGAGWNVVEKRVSPGESLIKASILVEQLRSALDFMTSAAASAVAEFRSS